MFAYFGHETFLKGPATVSRCQIAVPTLATWITKKTKVVFNNNIVCRDNVQRNDVTWMLCTGEVYIIPIDRVRLHATYSNWHA